MRSRSALVFLALLCVSLGACYRLVPSKGGGKTSEMVQRAPLPSDVAVPEGYVVELVAAGLDLPVGVTFDAEGRAVVVEAGYSYGELFRVPRLVRLGADGSREVLAEAKEGLWTGAVFHPEDGHFYVAEGGVTRDGRILRVGPGGELTAIAEGIPTFGDHHTNGPAVGPDGAVYFGVGTMTNSGVVGPDNHEYGWLARHPQRHDIPCRDITLTGRTFVSPNPLTPEPDDEVVTGAYQPFGTSGGPGQIVRGELPCHGAVIKVPAQGGQMELVAWGFRNPWGLAFHPDGTLFVTDNGYDQRGTRPVFGAADVLWRVEPGRWYGWPDHNGSRPVDSAYHTPPGRDRPPRLIESESESGLGNPPSPAAALAVHSSSNGFDFSRSEAFGHVGEAFVAQFGDMVPKVGKTMEPVGFRVVRVDVQTGVSEPFAINRQGAGPASRHGGGGLERPVAARFNPSGDALYIVDFGVMAVSEQGPSPMPASGVLWRVRRQQGAEAGR